MKDKTTKVQAKIFAKSVVKSNTPAPPGEKNKYMAIPNHNRVEATVRAISLLLDANHIIKPDSATNTAISIIAPPKLVTVLASEYPAALCDQAEKYRPSGKISPIAVLLVVRLPLYIANPSVILVGLLPDFPRITVVVA